jgi:small subunit ribosomal protein S2
MVELETMDADGSINKYPKKEVIKLHKEGEKLGKYLSGIKDMKEVPSALFVIDPRRETIAVMEARKLDVPVIAIVDTNCDPEVIDYPIPGNDDAIRAIELIVNLMANAFIEGRQGVDGSALVQESGDDEISADSDVIEIREKLDDEYSEVGEKVANQELEERKGWKESI